MISFRRQPIAWWIAPLLLAATGCSDDPPPLPTTVIIGPSARIHGSLVPRSAIVIEGDLIKAAGAQGAVPIPAGSTKMDLTGKHIVEVPDPGAPATFASLTL